MRRWLATVTIVAMCSAVVRADVTLVQTITMEGAMAAMGGANMSPKITTRVKGTKARTDVDISGDAVSTITDVVAKQMIILRHGDKTAQVAEDAPASAPATMSVKIDAAVTPTGKSQVIEGFKCDEFTFTATVGMAEITGPQMPPEAAGMMKDLSIVMKGSTWVAKEVPAAAEYVTFQKALSKSDLAAAGMKAAGLNIPGMDKMMRAMASVDGVACLTVMDLTIEGSGQIADMMRLLGGVKVTIRVTSLSADPLSDDLFTVPEGYTVIK